MNRYIIIWFKIMLVYIVVLNVGTIIVVNIYILIKRVDTIYEQGVIIRYFSIAKTREKN